MNPLSRNQNAIVDGATPVRRWVARAAATGLAAGVLALAPVASASAACEESTSREYVVTQSEIVPAGSLTVGPSTGTITHTVTAGTSVTETSTLSAGLTVTADVFFAEASATGGVSYSDSVTVTSGTSTTLEFPPSSSSQIGVYGIRVDDIMVRDHHMQSGCNVIVGDPSYSTATAAYAQVRLA